MINRTNGRKVPYESIVLWIFMGTLVFWALVALLVIKFV